MKKHFILLFLSTLITVYTFAQEFNINYLVSPVFKLENGLSMHSFQCFSEDGDMIVGHNFYKGGMARTIQGYELTYLDNNLNRKQNITYEKKNSIVLSAFIKKNKLYLVEAHFEIFKKDIEIVMSSASLDDFKFSETKLFTASSKGALTKLAESALAGKGDSPISVTVSDDKNYFFINFEESSKDATTYDFYLYNLENELIFHQSTTKNIKDSAIDFQNIYFDDNGKSAFFLLKIKNKDKKSGGKYFYEFYKVSKEGIISKTLNLGDKYIPQLKTLSLEGHPICLGIYSDENDKKGAGLVFFKFNSTNLDIEVEKFSNFSEQYFIDKYGKDRDKETKNVYVRSIFANNENTIMLNAEEYYTKGESNFERPTYRYYKDIISTKLDNNGDFLWSRNIDKYQGSAGGDGHLSFKTFFKNGYTYLIMNNSRNQNFEKNKELILKGSLENEKCDLVVLVVAPDGSFHTKKILDAKDNPWPFLTNEKISYFSENSIYLTGWDSKKWQILKLIFD
ncbi:MAG: hypothetical protein R2786_02390 [Flavobacteriaceae bacterium]